jgi:hypothetical protein
VVEVPSKLVQHSGRRSGSVAEDAAALGQRCIWSRWRCGDRVSLDLDSPHDTTGQGHTTVVCGMSYGQGHAIHIRGMSRRNRGSCAICRNEHVVHLGLAK